VTNEYHYKSSKSHGKMQIPKRKRPVTTPRVNAIALLETWSQRIHELTMAKRLGHSKILLKWNGGDDIIVCDEKMFVLQHQFNVQNPK
jgi:hypothetical protein